MPRDVPLPEDFWTDSPVHVSKLSDREFNARKERLMQAIDKKTTSFYGPWNQETAEQFKKILQRRAGYSLPLPMPVKLVGLAQNYLLAIFSKMHPRSFSRSMRLCKNVNGFLNKNLTKFSIRNRNGELQTGYASLSFRRDLEHSTSYPIDEPGSILPFTFASISFLWDGKTARDILEQMKWPFYQLNIWISDGTQLHPKPWMMNVERLTLGQISDKEYWELVKALKPKKLRCELDRDVFPISEQLNSAPSVNLEIYKLSTLIEEWRSGEWSYTANLIAGSTEEPQQNIDRALADCFSFNLKEVQNIKCFSCSVRITAFFVLRLNDRMFFWMVPNIRTLADQDKFLSHSHPIDYLAYTGDLDAVLDPQAFRAMFVNYGTPFINR